MATALFLVAAALTARPRAAAATSAASIHRWDAASADLGDAAEVEDETFAEEEAAAEAEAEADNANAEAEEAGDAAADGEEGVGPVAPFTEAPIMRGGRGNVRHGRHGHNGGGARADDEEEGELLEGYVRASLRHEHRHHRSRLRHRPRRTQPLEEPPLDDPSLSADDQTVGRERSASERRVAGAFPVAAEATAAPRGSGSASTVLELAAARIEAQGTVDEFEEDGQEEKKGLPLRGHRHAGLLRREASAAPEQATEALVEVSSVGNATGSASAAATGNAIGLASTSLNASARVGALPDPNVNPRDIGTSDGNCDVQETEMDDSQLGSIMSFSNHRPFCHGDHVLRKWKLFMAGTITRFKIQYTCCTAMFVGNCARNATEWTAPTGNPALTDTYYKHKLDCFEKENDPAEGHIVFVQRGFHQEVRQSDKALRFEYWCCEVQSAGKCKTKETTPQNTGRGNVAFLELHHLECDQEEAISRWQLVPAENNLMKFVYTCCPVDKGLPSLA